MFVQACNSDQYVAVPREDMIRMLKQKGQPNTSIYIVAIYDVFTYVSLLLLLVLLLK